MAKWRATREKFFALGLPAESCTAPARALAAVHVASSTLELAGHGLSENATLRFVASGGTLAAPAALPAPLVATTLYQAAPTGGDLFRVRDAGALVILTNAGVGVISVVPDYLPKLDQILEFRARWCDDHATPYQPPFETPPESIEMCSIHLAAYDFALVVRASSPGYSLEDLKGRAEQAQVFLDKLQSGKPLAVQPVDQTPTVAELGAKAFSRRPARGFRRDAL